MTGNVTDMLVVVKEYGLAGMLAWLFWWTLRRMIASHDATVRNLKDQLASQAESARETSKRFSQVVENHMVHVGDAVARFEGTLVQHLDNQRQVTGMLLDVLNRIGDRLGREGVR